MRKTTTMLLQGAVTLIGTGIFALMLWGPHLEGRNDGATIFAIYFKDPFLAYAYVGSIPFFVALFKIYKALGYAGQGRAFSHEAADAMRMITYCMSITAFAIVLADAYLMLTARGSNEDAAGAVMLGLIATFICIVIGFTAATFERNIRNAVRLKSSTRSL